MKVNIIQETVFASKPDKSLYESIRMAYRTREDLMKMRVQAGNRLIAHFYTHHLGIKAGDSIFNDDSDLDLEITPADSNETVEAKKQKKREKSLLDVLKKEYNDQKARIIGEKKEEGIETRGAKKISKRDLIITIDNFIPTPLIPTFPEAMLVKSFLELEKLEAEQEKDLETLLMDIPFYVNHLKPKVKGVGVVMSAFIISEFDIWKVNYPSQLIAYAGLDPDKKGVAHSTKSGSQMCTRLFYEFETKNIKEPTILGTFYNQEKYSDKSVATTIELRPFIDSNKRMRQYLGRVDLDLDVKVTKAEYSEMISGRKLANGESEIYVDGIYTGIRISPEMDFYCISAQSSIPYNKRVQVKMIGALWPSLLKQNPEYRKMYHEKVNGLTQRPITLHELQRYSTCKPGKKNDLSEYTDQSEVPVELWEKAIKDSEKERKGKISRNAIRRCLRQFLINDVFVPWRKCEGLPVTTPYEVGVLGMEHKTGRHHQ